MTETEAMDAVWAAMTPEEQARQGQIAAELAADDERERLQREENLATLDAEIRAGEEAWSAAMRKSGDDARPPLTELTELGPFHAMFKANEFIALWESAIGRALTPVERTEMMAWLKASAAAGSPAK